MLLMTASVAVRRRWPFAMACGVLTGTALLGAVAGFGTSLAHAITYFCALYALAVWTDTRRFAVGIGVLLACNWVPYAATGGNANDTMMFTWVPIVAMLLVRG